MRRILTKVVLCLVVALTMAGTGCKKTPKRVYEPLPALKEAEPKPEPVDIIVLASYKIVEYRENKSGSWRKLEKGESLSAGDEVRTGDKGVFSAKFPDGSIIRVNQNTDIDLNKDDQSSLNINLNSGEIYAIMKSIKKPYPVFRITTPAVITGVRGTEYDVRHTGNTSAVFVLSGRVEVKNDAGKYTLNTGMKTTAAVRMAPTSPQSFDSEVFRKELDAWMKPIVRIEQGQTAEDINDIEVRVSGDAPGVGLFKPGMTLDEVKAAASAYDASIVDEGFDMNDGPMLFLLDNSNTKKFRFSIAKESIDPIEQRMIDESNAKIGCIYILSSGHRTVEGIRIGDTFNKAISVYGEGLISFNIMDDTFEMIFNNPQTLVLDSNMNSSDFVSEEEAMSFEEQYSNKVPLSVLPAGIRNSTISRFRICSNNEQW